MFDGRLVGMVYIIILNNSKPCEKVKIVKIKIAKDEINNIRNCEE